ncbi:hypothetical protein GQ600_16044 [Phytophthora cactorum]|nr:hypothetical protein GQ600_16044 [Phytophthora cactorum]
MKINPMSDIPLEGFKHRFASDAAAGSGFLEIIQWLHFNIQARSKWPPQGIEVAPCKSKRGLHVLTMKRAAEHVIWRWSSDFTLTDTRPSILTE